MDFQAMLGNLPLPAAPSGAPNGVDPREQRLARVAKVMGEMRPQMRAAYANAYAQNFSLQELRGLRDFYRSALGVKLAAEQPAISRDVMGAILPQIMAGIMAQMPPPAPAPAAPSAPQQ